MNYNEKVEALKEIILRSIPQSTDCTPHDGKYSVDLLAVHCISIGDNQYREVTLHGKMQNNRMDMELVAGGNPVFQISEMPLITRMGDQTPIYKIVRDSILFSYAVIDIPDFYKALKATDIADYPFAVQTTEMSSNGQVARETAFLKNLATLITDEKNFTHAEAQFVCPGSSRLKEAMNWHVNDRSKMKAMNATLKALMLFAPQKGQPENCIPDIYVSKYDRKYIDEINAQRIVVLNTGRQGAKEKFWWDYFKLNVFLDEPEYNRGYYLLLNSWKVDDILKWIAEYRQNGWYETSAGQSLTVFVLKSTAESPIKIVNIWGRVVKVPLRRNPEL